MSNVVKIAVQGAMNLPYTALEPFQGDLKTLDKENYEKLRQGIIDLGFSFVFHIWQHEGHNYIIDGHQRLFTLKQMVSIESWEVPDVPVAIVSADSFAEAKRKVLAGASTFGTLTEKSLNDYMKENDIPIDEVVKSFQFDTIDMQKFVEKYHTPLEVPKIPEDTTLAPKMPSSSEHVKQIQLFFNNETFEEFMTKINGLSSAFAKDNVTDVVMECVREVYQSKYPVPQ